MARSPSEDMMKSRLEYQAMQFAALAHGRINHLRKYTGEPYIVHPAQVAGIVRTVQHDVAMLCAAWLHDTREDCGVSHQEILVRFGQEVATLVDWLTDVSKPADGNRAYRKAMDRDHLAEAPARAQTVKLADIIDNTTSIVAHDRAFSRVYLLEASELLSVLTQGDADLRSRAWEGIENGRRLLGA